MRKKYWKTGCVIATLLCLTACGKAQTGEITPLADNMIHLYLAETHAIISIYSNTITQYLCSSCCHISS